MKNSSKSTIIIGHRLGALAVLKALETKKVEGTFIITATVKYFGPENENRSGLYDEGNQMFYLL